MESGPTPRTETTTFERDLSWCYEAVQDVSRTFAITIDVLEEPTSSRICVGYLLCRIADTIEDARHIPPDEQAALLREYADVLAADEDGDPVDFRASVDPWLPDRESDDWSADWAVVDETPRVVHTFERLTRDAREAIRQPVLELTVGMATFVERYDHTGGLRIETVEELEEYCWYAAGTVGELITNLVGRTASPDRTRHLRREARSFALLLQLVNVAKDVADDYEEENNVYLPVEWLEDEGVTPQDIPREECHSNVARVVSRVTERAAGYLDGAQSYLERVPEHSGNRLAAWAIPYLLAVGTIRELRKRPRDVFSEEGVKVSRSEVYAIITRFEEGVDRDELGSLRERIEREPYGAH